MDTPLVLAIDQGGQSTRVAVYSVAGEQLCMFSSPCATYHRQGPDGEHIEQDPIALLKGVQDCLQGVQRDLGGKINRITRAGFAGQGSSLLCWSRTTGAALSPVLSWQDIRGRHLLADIPITDGEVQRTTGLRLSPHYGASKIRWCLDHLDPVKAALANSDLVAGPIVSYLFQHLLIPDAGGGELLLDPGHAQRTLLWNLHSHRWDSRLLANFGVPEQILPRCTSHNGRFGDLRLGPHRIPVAACARDQGASLFADGLPDGGTCYINLGTGAFIQCISKQLVAPSGLLVSPLWIPAAGNSQQVEVASPTCYWGEDWQASPLFAWEATVNGAAAAMAYVEQQSGTAITPDSINAALAAPAVTLQQPCYFLNAVGGLSAPYWRTDLQSCFSEGLSPTEKVLAWLESILFQITVNVRLMSTAINVEKIVISGGLSRADGICQRLADITGLIVYRRDNTDATLQGIAFLASGCQAGWQTQQSVDMFSPQPHPQLHERFAHWQAAMQRWLQQ